MLDERLLPVIVFVAGCFAQLLYLTWGHWTRRHITAFLIIGPLGWLYAASKTEGWMATLIVATSLVLATSISLRSAIVPTSRRHSLFLSILPLWALLLLEADWAAGETRAFFVGLVGLTLFVVTLVARQDLSYGWRVAGTVVALLQLVLLVGLQFRLTSLMPFFGGDPPSLLVALSGGLLFSFLVAHLAQVYAIVRPPGTETAKRDSREARRAHLDLLASRFQETPLRWGPVGAVLVLFAAYWGIARLVFEVEPLVLLWPWLALAPLVLGRNHTPATASPTA